MTGISFDGGYADYMIAPATALALVPEELPAPDAAPLMCAGVTTFNALRNSGPAGRPRRGPRRRRARPPRRAVRGQDGLPHRRHRPREGQGAARPAARRAHYIDSQAADPAAELAKLGGAKVVLATVTTARRWAPPWAASPRTAG